MASVSQMALLSGGSVSTSYANSGGTGNRAALITVTASAGLINSGYSTPGFIDGSFTGNTTNSSSFATVAVAGAYLRFDFGSGASKVINEAKWYQSTTDAEGTWKWQGSNDASTWTDIGSSFALGGSTPSQIITTLSANTSGYRYYQMLGVSGTASNNPYLNEIEFKISA